MANGMIHNTMWKHLGNYSGSVEIDISSVFANADEFYISIKHTNEWQATIIIPTEQFDSSTIQYFQCGSSNMVATIYATNTYLKVNSLSYQGASASNWTVYVYYR